MLDERYKDNCYADVKPSAAEIAARSAGKHVRKKKLVNRRTQTYLRELLWLEGEEIMEADQVVLMEEEPEIDDLFT